jgi:MtN3 and saliva related transmembrane protein
MTEILAIVATAWGIAMAASPLLQIRRMRATGSSADLSISYMSVLVVGFALWLAYGWAIGNAALIVCNSAAFMFGLITIVFAWQMRRANRGRALADTAGRPLD